MHLNVSYILELLWLKVPQMLRLLTCTGCFQCCIKKHCSEKLKDHFSNSVVQCLELNCKYWGKAFCKSRRNILVFKSWTPVLAIPLSLPTCWFKILHGAEVKQHGIYLADNFGLLWPVGSGNLDSVNASESHFAVLGCFQAVAKSHWFPLREY